MSAGPVRILAVDGSFLARSRFEVGSLPGGFLDKIQSLEKCFKSRMTFVAWDGPGHLAPRREIYPSYKAKRKPPPDGFRPLVAELRRALPWFGVHQFEGAGEADDVLATIARTYPGPVALYSRDKDLLQLVEGDVVLIRAGAGKVRDETITADTIRSTLVRYQGADISGLDAQGWLDLQTLAGDSCDGVPGVPGIGPKRALEVLRSLGRINGEKQPGWLPLQLGTLLQMRETGVDLGVSTRVHHVLAYLDRVAESRALVQLYTIDLDVQPADPDPERARGWLESQGLHWLARRMAA